MAQNAKKDEVGNSYAQSLLSTPRYVPPEMATTFTSYKKSDIFQLGILFHELLTGEHPFARCELYNFKEGDENRESELVKYVPANTYNDYNSQPDLLKNDSKLNTIIGQMLNKDYKKRPDAKSIVLYLSDVKYNISDVKLSEASS
jgi:serine/threonine protein kinase